MGGAITWCRQKDWEMNEVMWEVGMKAWIQLLREIVDEQWGVRQRVPLHIPILLHKYVGDSGKNYITHYQPLEQECKVGIKTLVNTLVTFWHKVSIDNKNVLAFLHGGGGPESHPEVEYYWYHTIWNNATILWVSSVGFGLRGSPSSSPLDRKCVPKWIVLDCEG